MGKIYSQTEKPEPLTINIGHWADNAKFENESI